MFCLFILSPRPEEQLQLGLWTHLPAEHVTHPDDSRLHTSGGVEPVLNRPSVVRGVHHRHHWCCGSVVLLHHRHSSVTIQIPVVIQSVATVQIHRHSILRKAEHVVCRLHICETTVDHQISAHLVAGIQPRAPVGQDAEVGLVVATHSQRELWREEITSTCIQVVLVGLAKVRGLHQSQCGSTIYQRIACGHHAGNGSTAFCIDKIGSCTGPMDGGEQ